MLKVFIFWWMQFGKNSFWTSRFCSKHGWDCLNWNDITQRRNLPTCIVCYARTFLVRGPHSIANQYCKQVSNGGLLWWGGGGDRSALVTRGDGETIRGCDTRTISWHAPMMSSWHVNDQCATLCVPLPMWLPVWLRREHIRAQECHEGRYFSPHSWVMRILVSMWHSLLSVQWVRHIPCWLYRCTHCLYTLCTCVHPVPDNTLSSQETSTRSAPVIIALWEQVKQWDQTSFTIDGINHCKNQ